MTTIAQRIYTLTGKRRTITANRRLGCILACFAGFINAGGFFIVQSRDITRPVAGDADAVARQHEIGRIIDLAKGARPDEVVFGKNELSEMLPRPTPLSLSLMEQLWAAGGSVELAARELAEIIDRVAIAQPPHRKTSHVVPTLMLMPPSGKSRNRERRRWAAPLLDSGFRRRTAWVRAERLRFLSSRLRVFA